MTEWIRKQIDGTAELIKENSIGGTLYGMPITGEDINVLLCAAYLFGREIRRLEDVEKGLSCFTDSAYL